MLVLIIFYGLTLTLLPTLSPTGTVVLHFCHALAWCIIHYFGLGLLLRAQSKSKFLVRHYLKNYHYSMDDGGQSAIVEAFANWKAIYNLSMCMTYGTNSSSFQAEFRLHFYPLFKFRALVLSGNRILLPMIGRSEMSSFVTHWAQYAIVKSTSSTSLISTFSSLLVFISGLQWSLMRFLDYLVRRSGTDKCWVSENFSFC